MLYYSGAGSFGVFSCVLDGVERQQSHRAVYRSKHMNMHKLIGTCPNKPIRPKSMSFRFVPRHADELYLETDDPVLMLNQSEDLWCQGYNMRTGDTGIFPAFYAVRVAKDTNQGTLQKTAMNKKKYYHHKQHLMIKASFSLLLLQSRKMAGQISSWGNSWVQFRSQSTKAMTCFVLQCRRYIQTLLNRT